MELTNIPVLNFQQLVFNVVDPEGAQIHADVSQPLSEPTLCSLPGYILEGLKSK